MSATQKWIIGILIMVSMAVSGYVVGSIKEVDRDLQAYKSASAKEALSLAKDQVVIMKDYVLKEDYKCAMDELKKQIGKMDDKLDKLIARTK
jgi:hypothetical protein